MTQTRLETLLRRTRHHAVLDLVLGAMFLAVMIFAGVQVGRALPKLATTSHAATLTSQVATTRPDATTAAATQVPAGSRPFFPVAG